MTWSALITKIKSGNLYVKRQTSFLKIKFRFEKFKKFRVKLNLFECVSIVKIVTEYCKKYQKNTKNNSKTE